MTANLYAYLLFGAFVAMAVAIVASITAWVVEERRIARESERVRAACDKALRPLRVITLPDGATFEDAQAIARTLADIDGLPEVER